MGNDEDIVIPSPPRLGEEVACSLLRKKWPCSCNNGLEFRPVLMQPVLMQRVSRSTKKRSKQAEQQLRWHTKGGGVIPRGSVVSM